jgi:hypothetical protein
MKPTHHASRNRAQTFAARASSGTAVVGYIPIPNAIDRQMTEEEAALVAQAKERALLKIDVKREMRAMTHTASPNDSVTASTVGTSLGIAGIMVGTRGAAAPILWQYYTANNYEQLRLEYPELKREDARLIAAVAGGLETIPDIIGVKVLSTMPSVRSLIQGGMKRELIKRALVRAGLVAGYENVQEGVQDLTLPAAHSLFAALQQDMPQVRWMGEGGEWERYWKERPKVAIGLLPLLLLGHGRATVSDVRVARQMMSRDELLGAMGFPADVRIKIVELVKQQKLKEATKVLQQAMARRSPEEAAPFQRQLEQQQMMGPDSRKEPQPADINEPVSASEETQSGETAEPKSASSETQADAPASWDDEKIQVQNQTIDGIFEEIYGTDTSATSRARDPRTRDPRDHGRSHARDAQKAIRADHGEDHGPGGAVSDIPGGGGSRLRGEAAEVEERRLIQWARSSGLLIAQLPARYQAGARGNMGRDEHDVFPGLERVVKITKPGSFGRWPVAEGASWKLSAKEATAGRYLERIINNNHRLEDDIVLHGVLLDAQGRAQIVTSQPYYDGELPKDRGAMRRHLAPKDREQEQRIFVQQAMRKNGFIFVDDRTYYRESDNTAIFDAHLNNVMWVYLNGKEVLVPFDVTVMHPEGDLRANLEAAAKNSPPIGDPFALPRGTGQDTAPREGTGTNARHLGTGKRPRTPSTGDRTGTGTARPNPWRW